jgi:ATP-dependent helicase HrpB
VSAHGREMARLGVHPRLAHLLLKARELGLAGLGAQLAALLSERDLLAGSAERDADLRTRLERVREGGRGVARVRRLTQMLARSLGARGGAPADDSPLAPHHAGLLLAFAYPDRIAQRRAGTEGRYLLANGRGAYFERAESLAREPLIVAIDLEDREREARIQLAVPLEREALETHFGPQLERRTEIAWSEREEAVVARESVRLDALVLEERSLGAISPDVARAALLAGVSRLGLQVLPWTREARELQARMQFVRGLLGESAGEASWPAVDDAALTAGLSGWLAPWVEGMTRREHLTRVPLLDALRALLSWPQQQQLEAWAPTHFTVPSGTRARIDYLDESAPLVAVRLQEVFGLEQTPRIGGGRVPLTFKLLSPAQRPVQITRDLASFWRGAYAEVRKDLRGRYPKHYWPENPLTAEPTHRARPARAREAPRGRPPGTK